MGWSSTHKPHGMAIKEFFIGEFGREIVDCAVVNRNTAYIAYRTNDHNIHAIVCLLKYNSRDYYNISYKDMDETSGPNASECPERILKVLTPIENEWANAWRKRCRENIQKRKETLLKLRVGNVLKLSKPITLTSGQQIDRVKVITQNKLRFYSEQIDGIVRLPKYILKDSTVIA